MAARIPMMAMTTSNSMSVKPEPLNLFDTSTPMPRPSSRFSYNCKPSAKNRFENRLMKYVNSQQSTAKVYITFLNLDSYSAGIFCGIKILTDFNTSVV